MNLIPGYVCIQESITDYSVNKTGTVFIEMQPGGGWPFPQISFPPHLNCLSSQIGCETGPEIPSKHDGGLPLRLQKCTEKKKLCANCKTTGQILLYLDLNTYSEVLLIALWNRPYHESTSNLGWADIQEKVFFPPKCTSKTCLTIKCSLKKKELPSTANKGGAIHKIFTYPHKILLYRIPIHGFI